MRYYVVKTTPEQDRFSPIAIQSYAALTAHQYEQGNWHDRLYCGSLDKDHATALAAHLNRNTNESFVYGRKR